MRGTATLDGGGDTFAASGGYGVTDDAGNAVFEGTIGVRAARMSAA